MLSSHDLISATPCVMLTPGSGVALCQGKTIRQSYVPTSAFKPRVKGITTAQQVDHKACGFVLGHKS